MPRPAVVTPEELLEAIRKTTQCNGYPPTLRELKEDLGLKSVSSLYWTLTKLKKTGAVAWDEHKDRTLRVVEGPESRP